MKRVNKIIAFGGAVTVLFPAVVLALYSHELGWAGVAFLFSIPVAVGLVAASVPAMLCYADGNVIGGSILAAAAAIAGVVAILYTGIPWFAIHVLAMFAAIVVGGADRSGV